MTLGADGAFNTNTLTITVHLPSVSARDLRCYPSVAFLNSISIQDLLEHSHAWIKVQNFQNPEL